ncbi:putative ABC transport system ATP-binding protein [Paramicrobacterium humi]|uniref:Putative ABC transport system ATP-binding protein n=1 Tax=Paramicrobacterium humi TaxID=640635 RepID=A0A1H4J2X4_9MICO|nr:ABC transporter ATP-binding protein [Microbacterium humi]SEB40316.1 putative ABC transport system ATP-binding protein [Microbacterium humi]
MYTLTNVTKKYAGKNTAVTALKDVDLEIPDGQFVAVQGPTGGGKSTLLQLLGALDTPTSGTVLLDDVDVSAASERRLTALRASTIGIVFQSFNLIPTLTALENVACALAPLNLAAGERSSRAAAALAEVGLGDRLGHLPGQLSGGQQQRVAIARALVKQPRVLLADEPTGSLDEDTRDEIMALLEGAAHERGLTLVIVTHDASVARRAERRLRMKHGRLSEVA